MSQFKMRFISTALVLASALTFSATAQAPSDIRIALIIGNSAYPGDMALANPANDAKDMAATLRNMGFGVIEVVNSDRAKMLEAIERAGKNLAGKQGIGMLFYAGHGLQLDWRNYMVPVDAKLNSAADVPKQAIDIEAVMNTFKAAGNRMNIVVLDACRDNPFTDGKAATGKGLAPLDAPTGTFLAYATAPGNVAADGKGKNGLYTGYLLQELQKPNASIENVFKRVRFAVRKESNGAQVPWETTSLEDDFVFNSGIKKVVKLTDEQKDKQFDIEKLAWDKIKDSKNVADFYAFVQQYPSGALTLSAANVIDRLNQSTLKAYVDKNGVTVDDKQAIYRTGDKVEYVRYDGYTKNEIRRFTSSVGRIEDGVVAQGEARISERGEIIRNSIGTVYDPPRPYFPSEGLRVGKKWASRSSFIMKNGTKGWIEEDRRVLAYEEITIPAGTFKAYKVEWNAVESTGWRMKSTSWQLPDLGFLLKEQVENRWMRGNQNADIWYQEATSISRGANKASTVPISSSASDKPYVANLNGGAVLRVGDAMESLRTDSVTKFQNKQRTSIATVVEGLAKTTGGTELFAKGDAVYLQKSANGASYNPPRIVVPPGGLSVGKKWNVKSEVTLKNAETGWAEETRAVIAYENVTISAGTFKAYKIDSTYVDRWGFQSKTTYWQLPDFVLNAIKIDYEQRKVDGPTTEKWSQEAQKITRSSE